MIATRQARPVQKLPIILFATTAFSCNGIEISDLNRRRRPNLQRLNLKSTPLVLMLATQRWTNVRILRKQRPLARPGQVKALLVVDYGLTFSVAFWPPESNSGL
jgi:hypothetical protein